MLPDPLPLYMVVIGALLVGGFLGLLTGFLAASLFALEPRFQNIALDVVLGALGFPLGYEAVMLVPYRKVNTYHSGNSIVTTTQTHFSHPAFIGFLLAVFLPFLCELIHKRLSKQKAPQ